MGIETIEPGSAAIVKPLNDNFSYLNTQITTLGSTVSSSVSSLQSSVSTLQTSVSGLQNPSVLQLSGTEPELTDNSEHSIIITGDTTFTVPTVTSTNKFHQMLVFLSMPTVYTLDFGTDGKYFYDTAPDMSQAGDYTIIYEFDGSDWFVGAIFRG